MKCRRAATAARGGEYHADCEELLLAQGSRPEDIWGADWYRDRRTVTFGLAFRARQMSDRVLESSGLALSASPGTV